MRARMSSELRSAADILRLGEPDREGQWAWRVAPDSAACSDGLVMLRLPHTFVAEIDLMSRTPEPKVASGGVRVPLSQARELLSVAAGGFGAIAAVTEIDSPEGSAVRRASIGSIARSSLEHSATATWVLSGGDRSERLKRSIILEVSGIEELLKFLGDARISGETGDLIHARDAYVKLANDELGLGVSLGKPPKIDGLQVPKKTEIIEAAIGGNPYPELSAFSHPNSFHGSTLESHSGGREGQFFNLGDSTMHTEGRLVEPALASFAVAVATVAGYTGSAGSSSLTEWATRCFELWKEWCRGNDC